MTAFDPRYGYSLRSLLQVTPPEIPQDFADFWQQRYQTILQHQPLPEIRHTGRCHNGFEVFDLNYTAWDGVRLGGWALVPCDNAVDRVLIVGHGYNGREAPDDVVPLPQAAYLFPCVRGLSRSQVSGIPQDPAYHVLYDIDKKDHYIMGKCVEDLWLAVTCAQKLFPAAREHIGYMGTSLGGGIGAMALPWDTRIRREYFAVPTFGHQPLRLELPSYGSAAAVQAFYRDHPDVMARLAYYDAAVAAQFIEVPVLIAAARSDAFVAPPGQFAIYNALKQQRQLFVLDQGHADYPNQANQRQELNLTIKQFFLSL